MRLAAFAFLALLAVPMTRADVCQPYIDCCMGYVVALEEAGTPPSVIKLVAESCEIPHNIAPGSKRDYFCFHAWERMSSKIAGQYSQGIIGFYPPECAIDPNDPALDPETSMEENLDPESEEVLENLEPFEER